MTSATPSETEPGQLARTVHQTKGAAGGYGFPQITGAAQRLEAELRAESPKHEIRPLIAELIDLCRRAQSPRASQPQFKPADMLPQPLSVSEELR